MTMRDEGLLEEIQAEYAEVRTCSNSYGCKFYMCGICTNYGGECDRPAVYKP